ncbi:MAG: hypothetical protein ACREOW_17610 [Thermodesulfobacteriota bacterium]
MNSNNEESIISGRQLTEEEKFYVAWGRESLKNNLILVNEVLRQLLTLSSALLGGSIIFIDEKIMDSHAKVVIIFLFLLSLVVSFLGMLPFEGSIDPRNPLLIKQHKEAALKWKRFFLWTASVLLISGFVLALIGIIVR